MNNHLKDNNEEILPAMADSSFWYNIAAKIICIGMLILALGIGHFHQLGGFNVETDFYATYAPQVEGIISGEAFVFANNNSPGYVYLLAAFTLIFSDPFLAGKILNALATGLFGWMTYLLFLALFNPQIALASATLLLISIVPISFFVAPDIVGAAFVMIPLWTLLRRPHLTPSACLITGLFSGLAYLARNPSIFLILGIIFSLYIINFNQEKPKQRLINIGIFLCGVCLTISPWLIMSWKVNGSLFSSLSYIGIAAHFYQDSMMQEALNDMSSRFHSLRDVLLYDPFLILRKYLTSILYWNVIQLPLAVLKFPAYLFVGAGFLLLLTDFTGKSNDLLRRRLTFFVVILIGYLLLGLVAFILRYYLFLFPFIFLSVAYFLFHKDVLNHVGYIPFTQISVSWLVVIILASFLSLNAYQATKKALASEPRHLLDITELLKKQALPNDIIIDRKPHLGYLTGLTPTNSFSPAESTTADEWYGKAIEVGARYIVYSDLYASQYWPGLKSLRDPSILPSRFQLIYRHKPTNTLIYEIDRQKKELP